MSIRVVSVSPVNNHHFVKAVVELEVGGLRLRGLKLEYFDRQWRLSPPGRKILGCWQVLYEFVDGQAYRDLLQEVLTHELPGPACGQLDLLEARSSGPSWGPHDVEFEEPPLRNWKPSITWSCHGGRSARIASPSVRDRRREVTSHD